jgi:CubicO group peptidase (beta-lactamase class C family)
VQRPIAVLALVLTAAAACAAPPEPTRPPAASLTTDALDADLAELVPPLLERYHVPGASVAVIVDGKPVLLRGYGRLRAEEDAPAVDGHTVFQAASLSKPVVAYGVHRLIAERPDDLDLDRPLSGYRPPDEPYERGDPRLERITARMVLSHTTGFPNWRPDNWSDDPKPLKIRFEPGTKFRYSGEGYVYLQRVVEQITGETLDVYLRGSVLDPLRMQTSSFVWEERFEAIHATPHDGKGRPQEKWRPRSAQAAGTLQTTAADYARFLLAVLGDGPSPEAAESWLTQVSTIDDRLGWSLGWGIEKLEDGDLFWQWGDDGPFKALVAGSPARGVAVVVFTNGQRGLNVARPVVERVLGTGLRFLDYRMLSYR